MIFYIYIYTSIHHLQMMFPLKISLFFGALPRHFQVEGDLCLQYGRLADAFSAFGKALKLREPRTARRDV